MTLQYKIFLAIVALIFFPDSSVAIAQSLTTGNCSATGNISGSFSPNCNNIYNTPPTRNLANPNSQNFTQYLRKLPRDRMIIVCSDLGDNEARSLALQVKSFLLKNGFKHVDGAQVVRSMPLEGINIDQPPNTNQPITIDIGSNPQHQ